jgi:GxxExxY protein
VKLKSRRTKMLYEDESYKIIGACMEVHQNLGAGFLEAVYQEALGIEFEERDIPFEQEKDLRINYKGHSLKKRYFADFVCYDSIILELKAVNAICKEHEAQLLNYLKTTGYRLGMIINFGETSLKFKRMVN